MSKEKTINIKKTVKKPSRALQLMVKGLQEQSRRKYFRIDMSSFGHSSRISYTTNKRICVGCAATCAIQKLAEKNLNVNNIEWVTSRARALRFKVEELESFEIAIDYARAGYPEELFYFFDIEPPVEVVNYLRKNPFRFGNTNWEKEIPIVEKIITFLKENGY